MNELKIIAEISAKPEFQEEIKKALHVVVDETRKEEGNTSYDLHQHLEDSSKFTLIEVWKSKEAFEFHKSCSHFQDFIKFLDGKTENLTIDAVKQIY